MTLHDPCFGNQYHELYFNMHDLRQKIFNIFAFFSKTKDIYHHIHLVLAMGHPYGKGNRRLPPGGQGARGGRHTLREIWHASNTTLDFAEWILSLEDQIDINNAQTAYTYTDQYYDSATHQWHPHGSGPAYAMPAAAATAAPCVLTPQLREECLNK